MHAAAAAVLVVGLAAGLAIGWAAQPAARQIAATPATAAVDPLAAYKLDYLNDAPDGSLAGTYLALLTSPNGEGQ
jgi:hypothetical protein